jgi:hypothetical protein
MIANHVAVLRQSPWRTFAWGLCQLCACALAVPIGLFASAAAGTIAYLPLMYWADTTWVVVLALCISAAVQCGWIAAFIRLSFIARRSGARFSMFLYAAVACGAAPHAAILLLSLTMMAVSSVLSLIFG